MALQRYEPRRVINFAGPSWDSQMTVLDPEVWWKFAEASGTLSHSGSDAANLDFDFAGAPVEYAQTGAQASASAITLGATGNASPKIQATNSFGDITSPATTGTLTFVFRDTWLTAGRSPNMFWAGDTATHNVQVFFDDSGGLTVRFQDGTAGTDYQATYTFTVALTEAISTSPRDGNWHMLAVVQGAGGKTFYWDGAVIVPSSVIGVSTDELWWMADMSVSGQTFLGEPADITATDYWYGHIDEITYHNGTELSAGTIASLWSSLELNVATGVAREGILFALFKEDGALPIHILDAHSDFTTHNTDKGTAGTILGTVSWDGTGTTQQAGITPDGTSILFGATGYLAGSSLHYGDPELADLAADTTGYVLCHFKDNGAGANAFDGDLFSFDTNTDNNVDAGAVRCIVVRNSGNTYIQVLMRNDANTAWDGQTNLRLDSQGTHDPNDGNWHQLVILQPADTNGLRFIFDGEFYDHDSAYITHAGAALDTWWASVSDNWSTSSVFSWGSWAGSGTGSGQYTYEGFQGLFCIGTESSFDTAKRARLFAASGI